MRRLLSPSVAFVACLLVVTAMSDGARGTEVIISINKAAQRMSVLIDGTEAHNWVISTGVGGGPHDGTYRPGRMERKWASRKYGMAPMPYSIFFDGNYAIHGTVKIAQLGRRASKGCVRLHPRDAAVLFELVGREKANTTIVVDKATYVVARPALVKSGAPPIKASAAKAETPAAESSKHEAAGSETSVAAPIRVRAIREQSSRPVKAVRVPLPFGMKYGLAQ